MRRNIMERKESNSGMLDLIIQPAFTVRDGVVDTRNDAAKAFFYAAVNIAVSRTQGAAFLIAL